MTPDEKGQFAIHDTMLRDRDFNRTFEHHNEPPQLPQITLNPTIAAQQKNMRKQKENEEPVSCKPDQKCTIF